jgi:hypothetical protein
MEVRKRLWRFPIRQRSRGQESHRKVRQPVVVVPMINYGNDVRVRQFQKAGDLTVESGQNIWPFPVFGQRLLENHRYALS